MRIKSDKIFRSCAGARAEIRKKGVYLAGSNCCIYGNREVQKNLREGFGCWRCLERRRCTGERRTVMEGWASRHAKSENMELEYVTESWSLEC